MMEMYSSETFSTDTSSGSSSSEKTSVTRWVLSGEQQRALSVVSIETNSISLSQNETREHAWIRPDRMSREESTTVRRGEFHRTTSIISSWSEGGTTEKTITGSGTYDNYYTFDKASWIDGFKEHALFEIRRDTAEATMQYDPGVGGFVPTGNSEHYYRLYNANIVLLFEHRTGGVTHTPLPTPKGYHGILTTAGMPGETGITLCGVDVGSFGGRPSNVPTDAYDTDIESLMPPPPPPPIPLDMSGISGPIDTGWWNTIWEVAKGGSWGLGQGGANVVNLGQDIVVGFANFGLIGYNGTSWVVNALGGENPYFWIPSPDWSRDLIVPEYGDPGAWNDTHAWSKFAAGVGLISRCFAKQFANTAFGEVSVTQLPGVIKDGLTSAFHRMRGQITVYRVEGAGNARIFIDDAGNIQIVDNGRMLFLNFGNRIRAEEFLRQRLADPRFADSTVKSFRVPKNVLDDLRKSAVNQRSGKLPENIGKPQVVDPTKAADQFGLRPPQVKMVQNNVIPGSGGSH